MSKVAALSLPENGAGSPSPQLHFAGSAITIQTSEDDLCPSLVAFLFRDVPQRSPAIPHVTYRLVHDQPEEQYFLFNGEICEYHGADVYQTVSILMDRACFRSGRTMRQGGLLLHAALLSWRGRGLLLPATTGMGKSTLAAWLIQRGYDYHSDEMVFVLLESLTGQAFRRPLNIKRRCLCPAGRTAWRN